MTFDDNPKTSRLVGKKVREMLSSKAKLTKEQ